MMPATDPHAIDQGTIWRWFAGIFAAPLDAAGLDACRCSLSSIEAMGRPVLTPGLRRMRAALVDLPRGEPGVVALAHAYALLFAGADGAGAVPPYESAFTTPNARLFGPAEGRMRALLEALDLHVTEGVAEPADHVAIELATMAELARRPAARRDRLDLARELHGWLGGFSDACVARDRLGFYAGAATATAALAAHELATAAPMALPHQREHSNAPHRAGHAVGHA